MPTPSFTDGEAEAWRGEATCPRSPAGSQDSGPLLQLFLHHLPPTREPPPPRAWMPPTHTWIHTPQLPCLLTCSLWGLLTESDLGQVQPVDPGDLAQGVGGDEDHHEADGAAGPLVRRSVSAQNKGLAPPARAPGSSLTPRAPEKSEVCTEHPVWPERPVARPAKPQSPGGGARRKAPPPEWPGHTPAQPQGPQPGRPAKPEVSGRLWAVTQEALPGLHAASFPWALSDTCACLTGSLRKEDRVSLRPVPSTWHSAAAWQTFARGTRE